jgi:hypothetical protein
MDNIKIVIFALMIVFSSCKNEKYDKKQSENIKKNNNKKNSHIKNSMNIIPKKNNKTDPQKVKIKKPDLLVENLDKLNICLHGSVENLKKHFIKKKIPLKTENLKTTAKKCEKTLFSIISKNNNISGSYSSYLILSGTLLDTYFNVLELFLLPEKSPGKVNNRVLEKRLIEAYNKFALKNNDLVGIPIRDKGKELPPLTLDSRTYGDETARMGDKIWAIILNWNGSHLFKGIGQKKPGWFSFLRRDYIYLMILSYKIEKIIKNYQVFGCAKRLQNKLNLVPPKHKKQKSESAKNNSGKYASKNKTPLSIKKPFDTKYIDCAASKLKSKNYLKTVKNFIDVWVKQLRKSMISEPDSLTEFKNLTSTAFESVRTIYPTLPPKVK